MTICIQNAGMGLAKRTRTFTQVNNYIHHFTTEYGYQFSLLPGWELEVQSTDYSLMGKGNIFLRERIRDTQFMKGLLLIKFKKPPSIIWIYIRNDFQKSFNTSFDYFHGSKTYAFC